MHVLREREQSFPVHRLQNILYRTTQQIRNSIFASQVTGKSLLTVTEEIIFHKKKNSRFTFYAKNYATPENILYLGPLYFESCIYLRHVKACFEA